MTILDLTATRELALPAPTVWSVLARYDRDPEWRTGVVTMAPSPPGEAHIGTTTIEEMRFGGRTFRNVAEVLDVVPHRSITWRTIEGADANGRRSVEPIDEGRCRATLELTVRPTGIERLLSPIIGRMIEHNLRSDLARLEQLATRDLTASATR